MSEGLWECYEDEDGSERDMDDGLLDEDEDPYDECDDEESPA